MNAWGEPTRIVFGYAFEREARLKQEGIKLAHYTTADTALQILDGRKLWMRNATVMNDHSEIQHGLEIVNAVFASAPGENLKRVLARISPGLVTNGLPKLVPLDERAKSEIFMTSLSEHDPNDRLGRLSMWRAYGGPVAGVALIFNTEVIGDADINLSTIASPVLYGGVEEFTEQLNALSNRIEQNEAIVRSMPIDLLGLTFVSAIQYAYMSLKHAGFAEELEWRLIHRPFHGEGNARVCDNVVSVRGIPQLLYELPLANIHDGMQLPNYSLDHLLHRVIIGPSLYPETVRRAFIDKLTILEVQNAAAKVIVSDIPLRQWG